LGWWSMWDWVSCLVEFSASEEGRMCGRGQVMTGNRGSGDRFGQGDGAVVGSGLAAVLGHEATTRFCEASWTTIY